jgi:uncharacterized protein YbaA (DUF1428 family)
MSYVDGAVYAVPTDKKQEFIERSQKMAVRAKEFGALKVVDCWGADVPDGELTSFPKAVQLQEAETVCLSWIIWPSQEVRDEAWVKLLQDECMTEGPMPFDGKRMIFGGFDIVTDV